MTASRERVSNIICEVRPEAAAALATIDGKTDLLEAGLLDSIALLQVLLELERLRGRDVDFEDIDVRDLACLDALGRLLEQP